MKIKGVTHFIKDRIYVFHTDMGDKHVKDCNINEFMQRNGIQFLNKEDQNENR